MSDLGMAYRCNKFDVAQCSRCKADLSSLFRASGTGMTVGYYEVREGTWSEFANPGERYLCDACMWKDPRYVAVYGEHRS